MTTTKTPAEAAYHAFQGNDLFDAVYLNHRALWQRVAQAAIDAHLASGADGLPSVEEIEIATDDMLTEQQLHTMRALFTERFAKLQAERDEWRARYQKWGDAGDVDAIMAERDQLQRWKAEQLAVESEWDANSLALMLGARLGQSSRKVIAQRVPEILAELDEWKEKAIVLQSQVETRREKCVPQDEHEEMKRVAVEALREAYSVFYDPEFLSPGTLGLAACDKMKEALAKLKGRTMSDTPRTDAAANGPDKGQDICISANFARQLERELNLANQVIANALAMKPTIEKILAAVNQPTK